MVNDLVSQITPGSELVLTRSREQHDQGARPLFIFVKRPTRVMLPELIPTNPTFANGLTSYDTIPAYPQKGFSPTKLSSEDE